MQTGVLTVFDERLWCSCSCLALVLFYMLNGFALIFFYSNVIMSFGSRWTSTCCKPFFFTSLNVTRSSLLLQTDLLSGPNYHEAAVIKMRWWEGEKFCRCSTNNVLIYKQKHSQLISVMTIILPREVQIRG